MGKPTETPAASPIGTPAPGTPVGQSAAPADPGNGTPWGRIGRVIGTLLGASLLGTALNLWYQNEYVPSTLPPQLVVTADLTRVEDTGTPEMPGIEAFQANIKVANPGKRRVALLAASFHLFGERVEPRSSPTWQAMVQDFNVCGNRHASMETTTSVDSVLASGRFLDQSWIDPGQQTVEKPLLYVPSEGFDALFLTVDVVIAKGDIVVPHDYKGVPWGVIEESSGRYCSPGISGDLNTSVIYGSRWQLIDRTPLIGGPRDTPYIVIEWRSFGLARVKRDGSGACATDAADETCRETYRVGDPTAGDSIEPMLAICDQSQACQLYMALTTEERYQLSDKYGISRTGTTVELSLWP